MDLTNEDDLYFIERYGLQKYHFDFFRSALSHFSLEGKTVLEIGGSNNPKELVLEKLGARKWVCLDMPWAVHLENHQKHYNSITIVDNAAQLSGKALIDQHDYVLVKGDAQYIPAGFADCFDVCVSNCSFEHIVDLVSVVNNIHKCLHKGGILYSRFAPIYSARYGSHFWIDENFNFNNSPLPPFPHLLLSVEEIAEYLKGVVPDERIFSQAVMIKHGGGFVNRLFYEDYEFAMKLSNFSDYAVKPDIKYHVDLHILEALRNRYSPYSVFDHWGIEIIANKN